MTWHFPDLSFRTRLTLLTLLTSSLGIVAVVLFLHQEWKLAQAEAYAAAEKVALREASSMDRALADSESALARLADRPEIRRLDAAGCASLLSQAAVVRPDVTTLTVRRLDSALVCSSLKDATPTLSPAEAARIQHAVRSGRLAISGPQRGEVTGRWIARMSYPVRDDRGQVVGVVLAPLDLQRYSELDLGQVPAGLLVNILSADGVVVASSRDPGRSISAKLPELLRTRGNRQEGRFELQDEQGLTQIGAFSTLGHVPWLVAASLDKAGAFAPVVRHIIVTSGVVLVILALALVLVLALANAVSAPLRSIAATAARVAGGDASARAMPGGGPELTRLALQFNRMLDELLGARQQREAMERHIETLVRNARDIVLLAGEDDRIVEANDAAVSVYGRPREALCGMALDDLRAPSARDCPSTRALSSASPEGALFEDLHQSAGGTVIPVEVSARVLEVEGRRYLQAFVRDISVRRAEQDQLHLLSLAVDQARAGMLIADSDGRIVYVNGAFARARGWGREQLIGQSLALLEDDAAAHDAWPGFMALARERANWEGDVRFRRADGAVHEARSVFTPLTQRDGHVSNFVLVTDELGEGWQRLAELEQRCLALERRLQEVSTG